MYNEPSLPTAGEGKISIELVDKNSRFYHVLNFISKEYGNDLEKLLRYLSGGLALGLVSKRIKNKKIKKILGIFQYLTTGGFLVADIVFHLKHYIKNLDVENETPHIKRLKFVNNILESSIENLQTNRLELGTELTLWAASNPTINNENLKILKYYNMNEYKEIYKVIEDDDYNIGILLQFKNKKIFWDIRILKIASASYVKESYFVGEKFYQDDCIELRKLILTEYISSLETSKNIIQFNDWQIKIKPRRKITEKINQFDVYSLVKEIKIILNSKRKRTFVFVGKQGVGKSIIIRKIEEIITEFPAIVLGPEDFRYVNNIEDRFTVIKLIQPAIVVIEDLDACGLKDKNSIVGEFLNCVDEINATLNIVILITINDTSLIHYSIIDRPGRSDRVIEIKPPQTKKQINEIILSKINSIKHNYYKGSISIPKKEKEWNRLLDLCLGNNFTQAEIANACVEQTLIDLKMKNITTVRISNFLECFEGSIQKHLETKKALKNCNFNNTNPNVDREVLNDETPERVIQGRGRSY